MHDAEWTADSGRTGCSVVPCCWLAVGPVGLVRARAVLPRLRRRSAHPTQSDPTTSPTTSSTTADTPPAGAPSFVVQGTTQEGDKVKVEGSFGSPLRPSESDVDQTALSECTPPAPDGRELVVRLDLTTTLESSLAGEVTLSTSPIVGPLVSFVMGFKEGARCEGGEPKNAEANFGSVQPGQSVSFTMWVVLPDAITPADPHPSEHALAAGLWLMGVPTPLVNGKGIGTPKQAQWTKGREVQDRRLWTRRL